MTQPVYSDVHDAPPVRRRHRALVWLRAGLRLLALLLALAAMAVAVLWWWAGTEGSLATATRWLQRTQPLTVQDVSGSLRAGGRIGHLNWQRDGLTVNVDALALAWQPLALLSGTLQLDRLSAAAVRVNDRRPPAPQALSTPPKALGLPLRVTLANLDIARIELAGPVALEARSLAGRYTFDGLDHQIVLRQLQAAGGQYHGQARLQASGPMQLDARLSGAVVSRVPNAAATLPLSFQATLAGPLADLRLQALVQADTAAPRQSLPHATATARITAWAAQPLQQAEAGFRALDLGALWPQAPQTELTGHLSVQPDPAASNTWRVQATADNAMAGRWDQQRLPLEQVVLEGEWRDGASLVKSLTARLARGQLQASGRWAPAGAAQPAWQLDAQLRGVDPTQLHSALACPVINGKAHLEGLGAAIGFDAALRAAQAGSRGQANATGLDLRSATARGRWEAGQLSLPRLEVRTREATLDATLDLRPAARAGSGTATLAAPGLQAHVHGALSERAGRGTLNVRAADTARTLRWLRQIPGWPTGLRDARAEGSGTLDATWQGGWGHPTLDAKLSVPRLVWHGDSAVPPWTATALQATVAGPIERLEATVSGRVEAGKRRFSLQAAAEGGQRAATSTAPRVTLPLWQARVTRLMATAQDPALGSGEWRVALDAPAALRWAPGASFDLGAGTATLTAPSGTGAASASPAGEPTRVAWQPAQWKPGGLTTAGRITGLPMAWIDLVGGAQMAGAGLMGDLVLDGEWDASLTATPRIHAALKRRSGDVSVRAESAQGAPTRVPAGVREAQVTLDNQGDEVRLALRWDSERAGTAQGTLVTRLARQADGWQWPAAAPLTGQLKARLPRIGVWSVLAPPGWRLRGSVDANLNIGGARAAPRLEGTLQADDLALRSVVDGIEFRDGRMRLRLDGDRLLIDEFMLRGVGDQASGGTLTARGEAGWNNGQPQVQLSARLERLRASIRTDRRITLSGQLQGRWSQAEIGLQGALHVDEASILLPDEDTPRLGDDVLVRNTQTAALGPKAPGKAAAPQGAGNEPHRTVTLAVELDLGDNLRVQGHGLDTRLRGTLQIGGDSLAAPRLTGTVNTFGGRYRAYGQQLNVEQGVLRFTGAPANPSLDILAIRPSMTQRVGVQITGSALLPRVRLYAQPDMPDAEKLSWLVLGRSSASGGAEAALLQQAALALLGSRGGAMSGGLAGSLGLDELSFRGAASQEDGSTSQGVVTLGKRFASNFYVAYERSLASAMGTFFVFYDLTKHLTVRGQAGGQSAVDLIYTLQYD
ncbi:MAG: translocation/assembly module TamB domain-containing protein [Ramlibacter sp.]|nr:translocation/assembly module TamB domain-containing protein [Ramlibacter sp.]